MTNRPRVGVVHTTAMMIATSEAHREVTARDASPALPFFLRGLLPPGSSVVASAETDSGVAAGWRVLTAQASLRIWMML